MPFLLLMFVLLLRYEHLKSLNLRLRQLNQVIVRLLILHNLAGVCWLLQLQLGLKRTLVDTPQRVLLHAFFLLLKMVEGARHDTALVLVGVADLTGVALVAVF